MAVGTLFSAFWILSANSWMQHPAAFETLPNGRLVATDWMEVIFSPSFPSRLVHMVLAAYLTTALVVGAASAWRLLRKPERRRPSRTALRMAIGMFAVVAPLQLVAGDVSGDVMGELQPAKLAAVEGFWETRAGQPFHIVALARPQDRKANRWEISVPKLGSLITKKDPDAVVTGLKAFPRRPARPARWCSGPSGSWSGLGLLMIALGAWGVLLWRRGSSRRSRAFLWACVAMGPAGFISVVSGWIVAEVGRQPWVVYGVLRTADAVSPVAAGRSRPPCWPS